MRLFSIDEMINGWFVGNFHPSALVTDACEVALKKYSMGESEVEHYHKIATEITLVASGKVKMLGEIWSEGQIIVLNPGEKTAFEALQDSVLVVVKVPGVKADKFLV